MPRWQLISDQLENAELLARSDVGRPKQAALRRAVSTAYYALFQALCEMTARELVGWKVTWDRFTPIFRSVEHTRAKQILCDTKKPYPLGEDVEKIGIAFRELITAREWADYSPEPHFEKQRVEDGSNFSRAEAIRLIEIARDAIDRLDNLDQKMRLKLAISLVARTRKDSGR